MLRLQMLNDFSLTVPKSRKPRFDLTLCVIDLTNIPLVVGSVAVKWHLPSSSSVDHRGRTEKARITEHRATWDYMKTTQVKMTIDKYQALQPCDICFEILQEYQDGGKGGRINLGNVKMNLAEYTNGSDSTVDEAQEEHDGMITRRYLMQDSKVNATLKIGISMKQIEGDTNYTAPPLKSAMTVGGIAGIINAEAGGDTTDMPTLASKSRELAEAQDIYRRTLAASWACDRGELPPDRLIEDLFAGGDGGKLSAPPIMRKLGVNPSLLPFDDSSNSSDADSRRGISQSRLTPESARSGHQRASSSKSASDSHGSISSAISGRGSIEQQMQHSLPEHNPHHQHHHRRKGHLEYREVTEFDLRDDLRSWQIHAS